MSTAAMLVAGDSSWDTATGLPMAMVAMAPRIMVVSFMVEVLKWKWKLKVCMRLWLVGRVEVVKWKWLSVVEERKRERERVG